MPSTVQYYEWMNMGTGILKRDEQMDYQSPTGWDTPLQIDIFNNSSGNTLSRTPVVGNHQFIVINKIGLSPFIQGELDIKVNQTSYFQNPDETTIQTGATTGIAHSVGISGNLFPYPCGAQVPSADGGITMPEAGDTNDYFVDDGQILIPIAKKLNPPIYILPGQTFSFIYNTAQANVVTQGSFGTETFPGGGTLMVFVSYTLHDGPEALVANQLLDMGVPVTNNNIDWLKRQTMINIIEGVESDAD